MNINSYNIVANGVYLDTYETADLSLNYQIDDIFDISSRNTSFSKSIRLPGTPINNDFFYQIFDVNVDNITFNPNKRIPGFIKIGDNKVFKGYIRLANIYNYNGQIDYEIVMFGSLKDILKQVEEYTLRDLDLSRYNHIRNATAITESWAWRVMDSGVLTETYGDKGRGYVYPYIVNGQRDDIFNAAYVQDFFPAVYIKTIIDSMFEFAGFTYTSEFFHSDYFRSLILPYVGDKIELTDEQIEERSVRVGVDAAKTTVQITPKRSKGTDWFYNDASWGYGTYYIGLPRESGEVDDVSGEFEFTDDLNQWNGSGVYTCQKAGRYNVRMDGKLFPYITHDNNKPDMEYNSGSFLYRYQMFLVKAGGLGSILIDSSIDPNDTTDIYGVLEFGLSSGTHASPWLDLDTPLVFNMSADDLFMEPGDKIVVRFGFRYPDSIEWAGATDNKHKVALVFKQSYDGDFTKFTVEPSSNAGSGNEDINLSQVLPDKFKMKDFFLNIIKMFNLIVMDNPDKENDLIIEPRDDFFESRQKIKDWNLKIDNDSEIKITPMSELDARAYKFTYKEDKDYYNEEYQNATGKRYGQIQVDVVNDFSDITNETELEFSPTPNSNIYINDRVAPFFVTMDDEEFKATQVNPRILFYQGYLSCEDYILYNYENDAYAQYDVYPYVGMWNHPTNPDYSLEFGQSDKQYWPSSLSTNRTLYEMFHKKTLNSIIDVNSKLLEAKFWLTPNDIEEFDFRDIIFLNGSYWRVNEIKDFNPIGSDSLTTVVLYKLFELDIVAPFQAAIPESTQGCPDDIVGVLSDKSGAIYISKSGKELTQGCCTSLGGNWQNGVCIAVQSKPTGPGIYVPGTKVPYGDGTGGGTKPPISEPTGPVSRQRNNNSVNTIGTKVQGTNNYVPEGARAKLIVGNKSSVSKSAEGAVIIGDGINAVESGTLYLDGVKINSDGIQNHGVVIITGGEDEVMNIWKTNYIDIIDGTQDAVRNFNGDSKLRPIIDGGTPQ